MILFNNCGDKIPHAECCQCYLCITLPKLAVNGFPLIPEEDTECVLMTSRVSYMLHYTKVLLLCDKGNTVGKALCLDISLTVSCTFLSFFFCFAKQQQQIKPARLIKIQLMIILLQLIPHSHNKNTHWVLKKGFFLSTSLDAVHMIQNLLIMNFTNILTITKNLAYFWEIL